MPKRRDTNGIGDAGENALKARLQSIRNRTRPLFKPVHLGEKYPIADFYVEVNNNAQTRAFCFIQVKSTTTDGPNFNVNRKKLAKLLGYGAPTYVALVDKMDRLFPRVFLRAIQSLPVRSRYTKSQKYLLTEPKLEALKRELIEYWAGRIKKSKPTKSYFEV